MLTNSAHISLATNYTHLIYGYKANSKSRLLLQIGTLLDRTTCLLDIEVGGGACSRWRGRGLHCCTCTLNYNMYNNVLVLHRLLSFLLWASNNMYALKLPVKFYQLKRVQTSYVKNFFFTSWWPFFFKYILWWHFYAFILLGA